MKRRSCTLTTGLFLLLASSAIAQEPAAAPAATPTPEPAAAAAPAPAPLPAPAVTSPVQWLPPAVFDAGPFGKLSVNGIVNGIGMVTQNHVAGDKSTQEALGNGQIFIQKTDGWWQFYVQAGVYNIADLGVPFMATDKTVSNLYGPVPVAFLKLQPAKNTSILIGALPTLIGAEYTFSFENMNIHRGLLWNQENAVNRGIQLNQTMGKFSASVSWNDGFYSNRYNWITGSLAYATGPHALSFVAGGNLGTTNYFNYATPVQNDGSIYNVIYTYTKGPWIIQPYFQYTKVPTNTSIGIANGASTTGGAVLASYAFKHGVSLAGRWEYIGSSGNAADQAVNLMYGPGSKGTSVTVTPSYQKGGFFLRGDLAFVHLGSLTPGDGFGSLGLNTNQTRAMAEIGFIFGNNITEKK
jgi:hypothetical protein